MSKTDLTIREAQVIYWKARGRERKTVAAELGVSIHTVDHYLRRIRLKLRELDRIPILEFYLENQGEVDDRAGYEG